MKGDKATNKAWDSYSRQCADCDYQFPTPDIDALLANCMVCRECGQVYEIDSEDIRFLLAFVLATLERLDRRTNGWGGIEL